MWHLEFPEMKAEVVVVALLSLPAVSQLTAKGASGKGPRQKRQKFSKGFLQSEVSGEVSVLEGVGRGEVFREVCREVFHEVFGLVLLGHSEQKKLQQKLQP